MKQNKFDWDVIIGYAPNTTFICKNEGYVTKNVDGSGVDMYVKGKDFDSEMLRDKKIKEKIISILN